MDYWASGDRVTARDSRAVESRAHQGHGDGGAAHALHVYVTLGNHEPYSRRFTTVDGRTGTLSELIASGLPAQLSEHVTVLPRPYRFGVGGREVLSLGGAASVDRQWRTEGHDWWPDEQVTDVMVDRAIAGGPADLMIVHESPADTPVRAVRDVLSSNPHGFPTAALAYSAASRAQLQRAWDGVHPELLIHGHMHVAGGGTTEDGRRVMALDRDTMSWNLALLDLATLTAEPVHVR